MLFSFSIPLDWNLSKNKKFIGRTKKVLNPKYVAMKNLVSFTSSIEIKRKKLIFVKNKIWVKIKVYKKSYKGDCHNLIEGIMDGLKTEIQVDDNYYAVVCDYEIRKNEEIYIEVGQE